MQRLFGTVTDGLRAIPGATVAVYYAGTETLATIYDASTGATPTVALSNPMTADGLGRWICAVPAGYYYTIKIFPGQGPAYEIPWWNISGVVGNTLPLMDGSAAAGTSLEGSRADHRHPSDTTKFTNGGALTATTGTFSDTTATTNPTTGSVVLAGGLGVAKQIRAGASVYATFDGYAAFVVRGGSSFSSFVVWGDYGTGKDRWYAICRNGSSAQWALQAQDANGNPIDDVLTVANAAGGAATWNRPVYFNSGVVMPKTSGYGIKVDTSTPTFPWVDLLGNVQPKTIGANTPVLAQIQGNIYGYKFVANDIVDFVFHLPHDYVPGTDIYFHLHTCHNGTNISGNMVWAIYATYAKGHNQADFPAEITTGITYNTVDITTTPQYRHRIDEVQFSTAGGSGALLNTTNLEVDGLIMIRAILTGLPTITGGSLFGLMGDIHYQSTGIGTKQKAPPFWT